MKDRKTTTLVYEGLGLPVRLVNVPMKKILGQWFLDINMETLQRIVLEAVLHKHAPLTGDEIKFIREYLELSTKAFGEIFGVSHTAVVKREAKKGKIVPIIIDCDEQDELKMA